MLSIIGLDNFCSCSYPGKFTPFSFDIWEKFNVPDGLSKDDIIDTIKLECGELPLIYTEPKLMQNMIGLWSRNRMPSWERMYRALTADYNPIHNYDREETRNLSRMEQEKGEHADTLNRNEFKKENGEHTDKLNRTETGTENGNEHYTGETSSDTDVTTNDKETRDLQGNTTGNTTEDTLNSKSAFNNAGNMVDANKQNVKTTSSENRTDTGSVDRNGTENTSNTSNSDITTMRKNDNSVTIGEQSGSESKNDTNVTIGELSSGTTTNDNSVTEGETVKIQGNIGVTTSQQMITDELILRANYDMDSIIAGEFKRQFCVMVY